MTDGIINKIIDTISRLNLMNRHLEFLNFDLLRNQESCMPFE